MKLFWNPKARKRATMFRELLVDTLESFQDDKWPSCEAIVMQEVDKIIAVSENDFASFPPGKNYEELVLNTLWDVTYGFVTSGNYHVYTGVLNFTGEQLRTICCKSAGAAKEKGYLSEDDYNGVMQNLSYCIKTFG